MELQNADSERRKVFTCTGCPVDVQAKRRCREDRWDFTAKDDPSLFPIYVNKGGSLHGFCPGKATWDVELSGVYQALLLTAETGTMLENGALNDQPAWFIEIAAWFIPIYNELKFESRLRTIFGDKAKAGPSPQKTQRR